VLSIKETLKILQSYNINSSLYGPSIYKSEKEIGICLEIKDSTFGFLTRYFTFDNKENLERFLKSFVWYKKNHKKWNIALTLDNYDIPNPNINYTYNKEKLTLEEMLNFEKRKEEKETEQEEKQERESLILNLDGITNYLIELKQKKDNIRQEKNNLKIKENDLKYELLEQLTIYYGKEKNIAKKPVNLDIITANQDIPLLQENLKNIKTKSQQEMNNYLESLVKICKEEELEEKYLVNIYSSNVYRYNIDILNKQIDFIKRKIESEKKFNLKGSKIHNIDEELKSFLKTNVTPKNIKTFLEENKEQINNKYDKINDIKESYRVISNKNINLPKIKKEQTRNKTDVLNDLKFKFDNLEEKNKAELVLYNSFYKNICNDIIKNRNLTIEEIKTKWNLNENYHEIEELAFNENNSHYFANYFKYLDFKTLDTYVNSLIDIANTVEKTKFNIIDTLTVFCVENKDNHQILSIEPIFNKKDKIYILTLLANTNLLFIPDKIEIDQDTKEMSLISTKNIYLKANIIDTSESITVNKYQKIIEKEKKNDIIITKDLMLENSYIFNVGMIEGE